MLPTIDLLEFEKPMNRRKKISTLILSLFFVAIGITHFTKAELFVSAVPPFIPFPTEMVYISGVFEILGGIGVVVKPVRKWAGIGLIALLIAVYPANIYMAVRNDLFPAIPPVVLWVRLLFQPLFIAWVWYCTLKK